MDLINYLLGLATGLAPSLMIYRLGFRKGRRGRRVIAARIVEGQLQPDLSRRDRRELARRKPKTTVVVLAGRIPEARAWCDRTGRKLSDVVYATPNSLRGLTAPISVFRVGTWEQRTDLAEIEGSLALIERTA